MKKRDINKYYTIQYAMKGSAVGAHQTEKKDWIRFEKWKIPEEVISD